MFYDNNNNYTYEYNDTHKQNKSEPTKVKDYSRSTLAHFLNYNPRKIGWDVAFKIARCHRTTWERWLSGSVEIPAATMELIRLHADGEPPDANEAWRGWCFTKGKLWTPDNRFGYTPSDINAMPYLHQCKAELENIKRNFSLQSKLGI